MQQMFIMPSAAYKSVVRLFIYFVRTGFWAQVGFWWRCFPLFESDAIRLDRGRRLPPKKT